MKNLRWTVLALACLIWAGAASGQSVDAFFGFGTLITGRAQNGVPKLGGGLYPQAGGDIIFLPHGLGVGAQVAWRGSQQNYFGVGTRPIYYTFNLVWEPVAPGGSLRPDFEVGVGAQSLRVYSGQLSCGTFTGCTNYATNNHFVAHAGIGLKIYWGEHLFLRPAVDYYNIRHNFEYGVPAAWQTGLSIGYTLGPTR